MAVDEANPWVWLATIALILGGTAVVWFRHLRPTPPVERPNIIILTGPPGAGKFTQAVRLADELGIPVLDGWCLTGGTLQWDKSTKTPGGAEPKAAIDTVERSQEDTEPKTPRTVSREIALTTVIGAIKERVQQQDCNAGFILYGFPRTQDQASVLDEAVRITAVICLEAPDKELGDRINGRWLHKGSGRSYHETFAAAKPKSLGDSCELPSEETMRDDVTGESLIRREDDNSRELAKRVKLYRTTTAPMTQKHYEHRGILQLVDGHQGIDQVWDEIKKSHLLKPKQRLG